MQKMRRLTHFLRTRQIARTSRERTRHAKNQVPMTRRIIVPGQTAESDAGLFRGRAGMFLFLPAATLIGLCAAAIYSARPKAEPFVLEFMSQTGAGARVVRYKCYSDGGLEACMKAAGAELCGDDKFEIIESAPLTYDANGSPLMSYRCFTTVPTVL